jgi:hypothetical protein
VNVFHPHQIKSAIGNRGTYDTTNPDITKAQGGAVKPTLDQMRQAIAARTTPRFSEGGPEDTAPTKQQKDRWDWVYRTKPAMVKTYGALARSQFNDPGPRRLRNTPAVVQQRITNANEFLDKPTEPWQPPSVEKQAFDRSDIQQALGGFPGIEQSRFPRDVPPRANISHVHETYLNPVNRALIKKQIARGLPLGGETFYASLYPVKLAAMERGIPAEKFDSWVHSIAPASARNSIMNEMAVGQAIRDAHARGSDLSPESLKADREAFRAKHGVGLPMMPIHETGVANVLKNNINLREHSRANIPTNYKIPTYGAQKAGDFAHSWVGDVHEAAGETLGSQYHPYFKEAGGFGNTEYGAAEKHMLDIANEMGIPGGTAQAGRWFGGGELTGLRSPRGDALDLLEKQVAYTLHHQGIAPTPKAVREYVLSMIDTGRGHLLPWFKKAGMPDLRVVNKAEGGAITQDEMLAHTTLGRKMPNVRNIGADEAPDMKVKQYIPPGPGKGIDLPAGGVDFQPEMPGHQLTQAAPAGPGGPAMPGMPGMPGMPPGAPGMPPGGPGPGMPGMPPPLPRNQPGMPTGKPAGLEPPNIPPPKQKPSGSNILSMTPQGQALAALGPMRKMADGGSVERMKRELVGKKSVSPREDLFPEDFSDKKYRVAVGQGNTDSAGQTIHPTKQGVQNFHKWFSGSHAVDAKGKPLRMYHSTNTDVTEFKPNQPSHNNYGFLGNVGVTRAATFLTPHKKFSQAYLREGQGQNVMPVHAALKKPFDLRKGVTDAQWNELEAAGVNPRWVHHAQPWELFDNDDDGKNHFVDILKRLGYDSAVFHESSPEDESGPYTTYAAFHPTQVKSALGNRGTYAPTNPDITKKQGGGVTLPPSTEQMRQALSARRSNSKA